jgi:Protein of unknown function (DUF4013)
MVSLEQVSRRAFADPSWFIKSVFGTGMLLIPGAHFWALGYVYRMAQQGRRGQSMDLPDWDDWRMLFVDGVRLFAIILVLTVLPLVLSWLISLPWHPWLGPLSYVPMVPVLLLAGPLTAAGVYRFQRNEDFREAFRIAMLFRMIVAAREHLVVPTLATIGFIFVLFPLLPYALFTGGALISYYYALVFHEVEQRARAAASGRSVNRR